LASFYKKKGAIFAVNRMKTTYLLIAFLSVSFISRAQTRTINATGNWDNTGIWQGASIADVIGENVVFSGGADKTATVRSGFNYTVGDIALANNGNLSIVGTLNVGASGTPKSITAGNGPNITVSGTLIIWGDLIVSNNLTWTISGTVIIKGDVIMNNGASLSVSGNLTIDGDFTGGNNTQVSNSGNIAVGGAVTVGGGTTSLVNTGTFTAGSCSPPASGFCGEVDVPLPVTLLFFKANQAGEKVNLSWATASELNFNYFSLERSSNGMDFGELEQVKGNGTTNERKDYKLVDNNPLVGRNYYRLKSVDFDGYTEYFNIVLVNFSGEKTFNVFPNPSDGTAVNFALNFVPEGNTTITIFDNYSSNIATVKPTDPGQLVTFATSLKSGLYFARIVSKDFVRVERFVVK